MSGQDKFGFQPEKPHCSETDVEVKIIPVGYRYSSSVT
jgi:hypothetical protein